MPNSWSELESLMIDKASRDEECRRRLPEGPIRVAEFNCDRL